MKRCVETKLINYGNEMVNHVCSVRECGVHSRNTKQCKSARLPNDAKRGDLCKESSLHSREGATRKATEQTFQNAKHKAVEYDSVVIIMIPLPSSTAENYIQVQGREIKNDEAASGFHSRCSTTN